MSAKVIRGGGAWKNGLLLGVQGCRFGSSGLEFGVWGLIRFGSLWVSGLQFDCLVWRDVVYEFKALLGLRACWILGLRVQGTRPAWVSRGIRKLSPSSIGLPV